MNILDFSLGDESTSDSASGALRDYRRWRRNNPSINFAAYLDDHSTLEASVVIELATTDLIQQISNGHESKAEEYIEAISSFSTCPDLSLDLVDAELCAKSDLGSPVDKNEFLERFPSLRESLTRLFEVHEIDLEASKNRAKTSTAPIAIRGYELTRSLCECGSRKSTSRFQLWEATQLSEQHPVQIVVWKDKQKASDDSFVALMERRSKIQHRALLSPVSAGKVQSNGTRYCYIVVESQISKMMTQVQVCEASTEFSEIAIARILLSTLDAANSIEKELGVIVPISIESIALTDSHKPFFVDFPLLGKRQKLEPLRQLGLLIFATCVQDSDTRDLEIHLDAGYEPIDLFEINGSVSRDMNSIYVSCIHPNNKNRYESSTEAVDDLKRLVDGKQVKAPSRKRNWFGF